MSYRNLAIMELTKCVLKSKKEPKKSAQVELCRNYIHKNYTRKIYLKELADEAGISSAYLSRLFSKETGMSIGQYIVMVRLEQAEKLLRNTNIPITEIAETVNFTTQSHFSVIFRKWKGITPTEYRKKHLRTDFF